MKTLLLVEDEAIIALAEKKILEGFGYSVRIAPSGEEAVELALHRDTGIDLILMDIDLGTGIDGTEAARRILASRSLPIVFLTSHSEHNIVEKVRGITRYGYIIKNSGSFVLQSSIEMAFDLFEAHERIRNSQLLLKTVIRTIPDLVWLKDAEGRYMAGNPVFERFMGAAEEAMLGKTDYDFFDKETADFFRGHDRMAREAGKATTNEEWITFADTGQRVFLETVKTPMQDGTGHLIGVLGIGRDITERKRLEEALVESEKKIKDKLNAITSPEGDIGDLDLAEIVDIPTLVPLMEDFSALTGMTVAILDTKGTVLLATGWKDICTKFHRKTPTTAAFCRESDLFLSKSVRPGEYVDYKCKNGMWDIVTPLYVENRPVGNIYSGQFFYDDDVVDEEGFIARAEKYGLDKEGYLRTLRQVPRFTRKQITCLMDYLIQLTDYVSRLSVGNLRLARTTIEKTRAEELLSNSVAEKEILLKELQHRTKNSLGLVASLLSLDMMEISDEPSLKMLQEAIDRIRSIAVLYEKLSASSSSGQVDLAVYIHDLVDLLGSTYAAEADRIRVIANVDETQCALKSAVPVGLILNELLTNAYKYAYSAGESGEIRVDLHRDGSSIELRVSDDGPGLPEGFDERNAKSLGLRITGLLAQELGGTFRFERGKGATAVVNFQTK